MIRAMSAANVGCRQRRAAVTNGGPGRDNGRDQQDQRRQRPRHRRMIRPSLAPVGVRMASQLKLPWLDSHKPHNRQLIEGQRVPVTVMRHRLAHVVRVSPDGEGLRLTAARCVAGRWFAFASRQAVWISHELDRQHDDTRGWIAHRIAASKCRSRWRDRPRSATKWSRFARQRRRAAGDRHGCRQPTDELPDRWGVGVNPACAWWMSGAISGRAGRVLTPCHHAQWRRRCRIRRRLRHLSRTHARGSPTTPDASA